MGLNSVSISRISNALSEFTSTGHRYIIFVKLYHTLPDVGLLKLYIRRRGESMGYSAIFLLLLFSGLFSFVSFFFKIVVLVFLCVMSDVASS